jgi:hypothetical protein
MTSDLSRVSTSDLVLLNNALNEVCNGVHIPDGEFATRLGSDRTAARELLERVSDEISRREGERSK